MRRVTKRRKARLPADSVPLSRAQRRNLRAIGAERIMRRLIGSLFT